MQAAATKETDLISRIVAGERELFHDLIRPYEKMVYLTVLSIVKNEADAEDGAQEAVINAYRHLNSFRAEAKFSTWLTVIAINEGRKRLRKAKGAAEDSIDELEEEKEGDYAPAPLTDWREIPLETLERKELREALREKHLHTGNGGNPFFRRNLQELRPLGAVNQIHDDATL